MIFLADTIFEVGILDWRIVAEAGGDWIWLSVRIFWPTKVVSFMSAIKAAVLQNFCLHSWAADTTATTEA